MPSIIDLKAALIAAGVKDDMEYYMYYLNEAIHGFVKPLQKNITISSTSRSKKYLHKTSRRYAKRLSSLL
jgi:hypothetical protein